MHASAGNARREQLKEHIRETFELISQYEEKLRLSNDPKEKARCRRILAEQREYLEGYQRELTATRMSSQRGLPDAPRQNTAMPSPQALLECLESKFRSQDLKKVYFLMGIGYDDLAGGDVGRAEKAMALIEYAKAREQLTKLFTAMQEVYPGLEC